MAMAFATGCSQAANFHSRPWHAAVSGSSSALKQRSLSLRTEEHTDRCMKQKGCSRSDFASFSGPHFGASLAPGPVAVAAAAGLCLFSSISRWARDVPARRGLFVGCIASAQARCRSLRFARRQGCARDPRGRGYLVVANAADKVAKTDKDQDEQYNDLLSQLEESTPPTAAASSQRKRKTKKKSEEEEDEQFADLLTQLEENPEPEAAPPSRRRARGLAGDILADIEETRDALGDTSLPEKSPTEQVVFDVLSLVFVADFIIIIILSLYLVIASILKFFFGIEEPVNIFIGAFDPYIQSLLGVLAAFRLANIAWTNIASTITGKKD